MDGSATGGGLPQWLISIVLSVISSIVFEVIRPVIPFINRQRNQSTSSPHNVLLPNRSTPDTADYRQRRQHVRDFLDGTVLYLAHILAVWMTLLCTFAAIQLSGTTVYLHDARFLGGYLPETPLSADILTRQGFTQVLFASILCYGVGWILAFPGVHIAEYFGNFNRIGVLGTACAFSYVLLAVHVTWIFTALSYLQIWFRGAIILVIFYVLSLFDKKRRRRVAR
jgi:hypothetical protein